MKIKIDFVTNSSSTSFCGFGITFSETEFKEALNHITLMLPKSEEEHREDFSDLLGEIAKKYNLTWTSNYDTYYLGIEIGDANMNETLNEIKNKVQKVIDEIGLKENVDFIQESWYNG